MNSDQNNGLNANEANELIAVLIQQRNAASDALAVVNARYAVLQGEVRSLMQEHARIAAENESLKATDKPAEKADA